MKKEGFAMKKRIFAVALAAALTMTAASLCGCGKEKNENDNISVSQHNCNTRDNYSNCQHFSDRRFIKSDQ